MLTGKRVPKGTKAIITMLGSGQPIGKEFTVLRYDEEVGFFWVKAKGAISPFILPQSYAKLTKGGSSNG